MLSYYGIGAIYDRFTKNAGTELGMSLIKVDQDRSNDIVVDLMIYQGYFHHTRPILFTWSVDHHAKKVSETSFLSVSSRFFADRHAHTKP